MTADIASLVERLSSGELRMHELDDETDPTTAARARRRFIGQATDVDTEAIDTSGFDAEQVEANIENLVGGAQVPLGVAGPVTVDGGAAGGEYYLPLATTEGALVASVNRGVATIDDAGGATVRVTDAGMTRAPVFRVTDVAEAQAVTQWVADNQAAVIEAAESTTSHGEVLAIDPYVVGDNVFLRFVYDTKDAMGMNMATIATRAASEVIERETPAELVALSGNLCADKKPAAINAIEGRGRTVTADVEIPESIVKSRLDTTPAALVEGNTRKNLVGSAKAASLGFNAHAANTVAAMFLATGQDMAQVVEGANAITTMSLREGGLYASCSFGSLEVGTVGGGTGLPTQQAALSMLGVDGGGDPPGSNADALAELIAVGALAGELSLVAAFCSRHLASAHEELGR